MYHPALLYESLWNVGVFFLLLWAEKRFRLTSGRLFTLYVASYTLGRVWIEALRVDDVNHFTAAVVVLFWRRPATPAQAGTPATAAPRPDDDAAP